MGESSALELVSGSPTLFRSGWVLIARPRAALLVLLGFLALDQVLRHRKKGFKSRFDSAAASALSALPVDRLIVDGRVLLEDDIAFHVVVGLVIHPLVLVEDAVTRSNCCRLVEYSSLSVCRTARPGSSVTEYSRALLGPEATPPRESMMVIRMLSDPQTGHSVVAGLQGASQAPQ